MSITREFNLFLNAGAASPLVINVNQYDQGEVWNFTLYSEKGIQYTPSTGAIVGIKSDNLGIINTGTVVDGKVVINETEQMTAAAGRAVFELMIDSQTHGTANFYVQVEPKPGNNADLSESDLSLIQQAIDSTNPEAIAQGVSDWMDDNLAPEEWVIDSSLSVSGAAADAKAAGDLIRKATKIYDGAGEDADVQELERLELSTSDTADLSGLKVISRFGNATPSKFFVDGNELLEYVIAPMQSDIADLKSQSGLTEDIKQALLAMFQKCLLIDGGDDAYDALESALYPPVDLVSISAVYTQSSVVYDTFTLDDLKADLVVTAHYNDYSSETVTNYILSGTLTEGTSTITVTYAGKTTTFNVTVTHREPPATYYTTLKDVVDGYYYNSTGEFVERSQCHYEMTMQNGMWLSFLDNNLERITSGTIRAAIFDENDDFVSTTYSMSNGFALVSSSGSVYFKCGWESISPNYAFVVGAMAEELFTHNGYVVSESDGTLSENSNYTSTDLIDVGDSTKWIYIYPSSSGTFFARIAFYNENNELLSTVNSKDSGALNTIKDIPTGTKYFRMSKRTNSQVGYPMIGVL